MINRKGAMAGLPVLVIVSGFIIAGFLLFYYIGFLKYILNVRGQVDVFVDFDDRGSGLESFLNSGKTMGYMEALGDLNASNWNDRQELQAALADVDKTIAAIKSELVAYGRDRNGGEVELRRWGEAAGGQFCTEIALPGMKKGRVCAK